MHKSMYNWNVQNKILEWKVYVQIHAVQSYQKEVNDKYLQSSDIQHTGPGRVTSIFALLTKNIFKKKNC